GSGAGGGLALRFVNNVQFTNVTFDSNISQGGTGVNEGGDALGAGFHADHSTVTGSSVVFNNNVARAGAASGGGKDTAGNTADGLGGAAAVQINSGATLQNVVATNNQAIGGDAGGQGGSGFGGAFFVEVGTLNLADANV